MAWDVRFDPSFAMEAKAFPRAAQVNFAALAALLGQFGPQFRRPYCDTLKGSRHTDMKELRFSTQDGTRRVACTAPPIEQELTLRDLRKARKLTQERIAELMGVEQENVSRLEHRADLLLSTLSSYVAAMGGKLRLIAEFPNRRPVAIALADITGETPRRSSATAKRRPATGSEMPKPRPRQKPPASRVVR